MQDPIELKACPYCGETKDLFRTWNEYCDVFIMCGGCNACGPSLGGRVDEGSDGELANISAMWNLRKNSTHLPPASLGALVATAAAIGEPATVPATPPGGMGVPNGYAVAFGSSGYRGSL